MTEPGAVPACDWIGCPDPAAGAVTFHRQPGHVHDCARHIAVLREHCDVAAVVDLPCPYPHGPTWTNTPKELT